MKLLWFSDLHTSTMPPPARSTVPFYDVAIQKIKWLADTHHPDYILCGGDVFHSRKRGKPSPSPWHLLALRRCIIDIGVPWGILCGNHDIALDTPTADMTPLSLLPQDLVEVAVEPGYFKAGIWADPYGPNAKWLRLVGLAAIHGPVVPRGVLPDFVPQVAPENLDVQRGGLVLVGDIHVPFLYQGDFTVINTGPLVRRSVDELNPPASRIEMRNGFADGDVFAALVDTDTLEWEIVSVPTVDDVNTGMTETRHARAIDIRRIAKGATFETVDKTNAARLVRQFLDHEEWLVDEESIELAVAYIETAEEEMA